MLSVIGAGLELGGSVEDEKLRVLRGDEKCYKQAVLEVGT